MLETVFICGCLGTPGASCDVWSFPLSCFKSWKIMTHLKSGKGKLTQKIPMTHMLSHLLKTFPPGNQLLVPLLSHYNFILCNFKLPCWAPRRGWLGNCCSLTVGTVTVIDDHCDTYVLKLSGPMYSHGVCMYIWCVSGVQSLVSAKPLNTG